MTQFHYLFSVDQIKSAVENVCLDAQSDSKSKNKPIGLWPCHGQGGNQVKHSLLVKLQFTAEDKLIHIVIINQVKHLQFIKGVIGHHLSFCR